MTFNLGRRLGLGLSLTLGLAFCSLLDACRIEPAPFERTPPGGPTSGPRFFARTAAGEVQPLSLRNLAVRVTTQPGTVRSHLSLEIAGPPTGEKLEAVLRLAIPPGAAVTGAVLWVDGHPMTGAFVERERARAVYRSIVARRRDPALVTWDGPGGSPSRSSPSTVASRAGWSWSGSSPPRSPVASFSTAPPPSPRAPGSWDARR
jgi:hypothetical protein